MNIAIFNQSFQLLTDVEAEQEVEVLTGLGQTFLSLGDVTNATQVSIDVCRLFAEPLSVQYLPIRNAKTVHFIISILSWLFSCRFVQKH